MKVCDLFLLLGMALVTVGAGMYSIPLGLIAAGLFFLSVGGLGVYKVHQEGED